MDSADRDMAMIILAVATMFAVCIYFLEYSCGRITSIEPQLKIKIRPDLLQSSNPSPAFDPLIRGMERFIADQQWHDTEYWALFNDFTDYVNDKDRFNVTNRLEVLFPQIKSDVHIADGYLTEHDLTQWMINQHRRMFHKNYRWGLSITREEMRDIEVAIRPYPADDDILKLLRCLSTEQLRLIREGKEVGMLNNLMGEYLRRLFKIAHNGYFYHNYARHHDVVLYHNKIGYMPNEEYLRAAQQAKHMFQEADMNKDGYLSLEEMIDKSYVFYNQYDDNEELYPPFHCKNAS